MTIGWFLAIIVFIAFMLVIKTDTDKNSSSEDSVRMRYLFGGVVLTVLLIAMWLGL
jgi:hypothetical protein